MEDREAKGGVYLNGREQVLELLRHLEPNERDKLVKNMRLRNPSLTDELVSQSLSFNQLEFLTDHEILTVTRHVSPTLLGLALKNSPIELQRRILSVISREIGEKAYKIMVTPLSNERRDCQRAQNRIKDVMIQLKKRRQIASI